VINRDVVDRLGLTADGVERVARRERAELRRREQAYCEACQALRDHADEVVCLRTPEPFLAAGHSYEDFRQLGDDEVRRLLARSA
jgi:predicted phosphoribosyltransferase